MNRLDCLMPAAGESARMGGTWKLGMEYRGRPVVAWSVEAALAACARVVLVVGHRGQELAAIFAHEPRVVIVENPDYRRGMFSSIRRGAPFIDTDPFFIALADMPLVRADAYARLREALRPGCGARPSFQGQPGHPVLLPATVRTRIAGLDDSASMREALEGVAVDSLDLGDAALVADLDTMDDFERLKRGGDRV